MKKRLIKYICLVMAGVLVAGNVPVGKLTGPQVVNAEEFDIDDEEQDMSIKAPAKIADKKLQIKSIKKSTCTISWSKITKNCKGYILQVSPYKDFKEPEAAETDDDSEDETEVEIEEIQTFKIEKAKTVKQKISGLQKNKTYYVRIMAYNESDDGPRYGKWSKVKKFKTKKK